MATASSDLAMYRLSEWHKCICWSANNFATFTGYAWGAAGDLNLRTTTATARRTLPSIGRPQAAGGLEVEHHLHHFHANYPWGSGRRPFPATTTAMARPTRRSSPVDRWLVDSRVPSATPPATYAWGSAETSRLPPTTTATAEADPAIYRPSTGGWWILKSSTGLHPSMNYARGVAWRRASARRLRRRQEGRCGHLPRVDWRMVDSGGADQQRRTPTSCSGTTGDTPLLVRP